MAFCDDGKTMEGRVFSGRYHTMGYLVFMTQDYQRGDIPKTTCSAPIYLELLAGSSGIH
jgi:hypothetical protein